LFGCDIEYMEFLGLGILFGCQYLGFGAFAACCRCGFHLVGRSSVWAVFWVWCVCMLGFGWSFGWVLLLWCFFVSVLLVLGGEGCGVPRWRCLGTLFIF